MRIDVGNCSFKTAISTPRRKKDDFEVLFKEGLSRKLLAPKLRQSSDKSLSQPGCTHSNTIYNLQLQKSIVLRMQPRHEATWRQPLQFDLRRLSCKAQWTTRNDVEIAPPKPDLDATAGKKTICKHFEKGFVQGKLLAPKLRKSADKSLSQPGCSHSNTTYEIQLQKTIVLRRQPRHQATLTQPWPCVSQHAVANLHASTHITTSDDNSYAAIPMRSASTDSKTPYDYAHTSTPKAAWSHRYTAAKKKNDQPTPAATAAQTRYLSSSPAATLHGKTQGFALRLPPQNKAHATFMQPLQGASQQQLANLYLSMHRTTPEHQMTIVMQPFQCDLFAQIPKHPITTHTQAHPKQLEATVTLRQKKTTNRPQPQLPHRRGTFHRRLQPLYTEKHKVSCSGFLPNSSLPFLTISHRHHFPSSPPPFVTTSLPHYFPSSPLPIVTTSLRHHFPSSPLPIVSTSHRQHFPSSPLPFVTTSLRHHFPSSPLPFIIISLRHHFPSLPLPFLTTSLRHHFPSSPLPFVTTSLRHHPSLTASYSFIMYCYVIYYPASFQVADFYLSVTRKYCFPTSFDKWIFVH